MGFNKKLLDHFSETLRCNQYPKRYRGDKAKIYDISAESDTLSAGGREFQRSQESILSA